jgi:hypothetical protein
MNKVKTDYIAENIDLLANLTWKELETIYYLRTPTLKDYSKNLPPAPVSKSGDKSSQSPKNQPVKSEAKHPELGIAQTIQKHMQEHVSTSPFAKLKSNAPASYQEPSVQPGAEDGLSKPRPYVDLAPSGSPKLTPTPQAAPPHPARDSNAESAWFIEPDRKAATDSAKKEVPQPAKPPIIDPPSAEIRTPQAVPAESSEISLDAAVEDAFGRMLKSQKKKISQPDPASTPPVVPSPEPKLLPYSAAASEAKSIPETIAPSIMRPAFDFSPAEELSVEPPKPLPVDNTEVETGDRAPTTPLDIKTTIIENLINVPTEEPSKNSTDSAVLDDTFVSNDVLRNLIQNHIKHASGQGSDFGQGQSIGSGKEYEVWLNNPARSKFIGGSKAAEPVNPVKNSGSFRPRVVPADIRKSCLILGLRPENLSYETVQDAWKKSIALPGVHPDQGGDTEMAVYLNTAKDILIRWLDAQAPKLGKKFGAPKKDDTK